MSRPTEQTDVIASSAHNWGLSWFEQKKEVDGSRTFVQHMIAQGHLAVPGQHHFPVAAYRQNGRGTN
jgi:hypothetical protein